MKSLPKKRLLGVLALVGAAAVLVACGGGGNAPTEDGSDPIAETERQQAQGLFDKLPVSWVPTKLVFDLNPGSRQTVPITLTTTKALKNARIVFVPDLRNAVTVSPETIPSLEAGKSATVTLTFAPAQTDTRKVIAGVVLLFDKNATVSRPLPVKVSLVKQETINGVAVPPEPPPELNNATLAGFDVNGNGVRDDVERVIAAAVPNAAAFERGVVVGRAYQRFVAAATFVQSDFDAAVLEITCYDYGNLQSTSTSLPSSNVIKTATINNQARRNFWLTRSEPLLPRITYAKQECR